MLPKEVLAKIGMTLDQISQLLTTFGVKADIHNAADISLDEFRKLRLRLSALPTDT